MKASWCRVKGVGQGLKVGFLVLEWREHVKKKKKSKGALPSGVLKRARRSSQVRGTRFCTVEGVNLLQRLIT